MSNRTRRKAAAAADKVAPEAADTTNGYGVAVRAREVDTSGQCQSLLYRKVMAITDPPQLEDIFLRNPHLSRPLTVYTMVLPISNRRANSRI